MEPLLPKRGFEFKSRLRVVVGVLWQSRDTSRERWHQTRRELDETRRALARSEKEGRLKDEEIRELKRRLELEKIKAEAARKETRVTLPDDPPVGAHGYGARKISLAVKLAQDVGLHGSERSMKTFFEWLNFEEKVPDYTTIRTWMQRIGVAEIQAPVEKGGDWIWIVDHSNQIGPEKALVILGIPVSKLPPPGAPLRRKDVRLLRVKPGTGWTTVKMTEIYEELTERCGFPRVILSDGARELQNSIEPLRNTRSDVISLRDFKHKAANVFQAALEKDKRFSEFLRWLATTRSRILQTELAFLIPPSPKQKARYMNLGNILKWSQMVLWLLDQGDDEFVRKWVTPERLEEKARRSSPIRR